MYQCSAINVDGVSTGTSPGPVVWLSNSTLVNSLWYLLASITRIAILDCSYLLDVMVTSQPQNVTNVLPGRMASFSVTAAGADSFTFQWQYGNGTNIPPGDRYGDVTTPTLVISSVIGGDNSSVYVCRE